MRSMPIRSIISCIILCFGAVCLMKGSTLLAQPNSKVVISEMMSSNSETVFDENGDFPDWVELYNQGNAAVNLQGWALSDEPEDPFRWVFPEFILKPGEFLVVYASNKDRRPESVEKQSGIVREVYKGISGANIEDLLNFSKYPSNPDFRDIVTDYFEAPSGIDEHYGQRMHRRGICIYSRSGFFVYRI